jgi:hypothetical protein
MEIGSVAQWVAAGVIFLAIVAAFSKEEIVRLWHRRKLAPSMKLGPPER